MAQKAPACTKYADFQSDPHLKRWLSNLARGSPLTAEVAVRRLGRMSEHLGLSPSEMVAKAKKDLSGFQDVLEDTVTKLEADRLSLGYILGLMKAAKSWLRYNDILLTRRIKITDSGATPTIENEQVPSQEELARILRASPSRVKTAIALIAFADLRPQTLGNHDGTDGLMLRDVPEMKIVESQVQFEKTPTMIIVRASLSKANHKYFTFLSNEGCTYLQEYLEERIRNGETLTPQSPLMSHDRPTKATKSFLITRKITHQIRQYMRKAGVRKRPYVLRAYAETQLIIAESKGKISHPYLQFIAGHRGDIEARYSTNKGMLPPDMIEDMRKCYKECGPLLTSTPRVQGYSDEDLRKRQILDTAKLLGYSEDKIKKVEDALAKYEKIDEALDEIKKLGLESHRAVDTSDESRNPETNEVRIVQGENKLIRSMNTGWVLVKELPKGKFLLKKDH